MLEKLNKRSNDCKLMYLHYMNKETTIMTTTTTAAGSVNTLSSTHSSIDLLAWELVRLVLMLVSLLWLLLQNLQTQLPRQDQLPHMTRCYPIHPDILHRYCDIGIGTCRKREGERTRRNEMISVCSHAQIRVSYVLTSLILQNEVPLLGPLFQNSIQQGSKLPVASESRVHE